MSMHNIYGVQTFVRDRKGRLAQGRFTQCADADEAQRVAEQKVELKAAAGAAAFLRRCSSQEFDDGSDPITLAVYGTVPSDVKDMIPF